MKINAVERNIEDLRRSENISSESFARCTENPLDRQKGQIFFDTYLFPKDVNNLRHCG
jgi:hypothetical protein